MFTAKSSTILVVDDQPTNLKILFSFLQDSGFKVLVAQTGESAIKKLEKVLPDLILLDVMLPKIDGFETCRRLKAAKATQDIPVIFMTALSESLDKIKGLKVGAVDYITKPFQQEEVLARIQNQLKIRRLSQQLEAQNKQLQQSQSLLESVLHTSQDGVVVFEAIRDIRGQIVDFKWILVNPVAAIKAGRKAKDLLGKRMLVEFPGKHDSGLFDRYVTVVETGTPQEREFYYDDDGIKGWFFMVAVKLGDGCAVTFRDITKSKQAEEALRNSERRFRAIFNNSFQYTGLLKPDGTVIEANQTVLDFGGIEYNQLVRRPLWEIPWWREGEKQEQLKAAIAKAAKGEFVRYEVEVRGVKNAVITIDFSIKPVFDEAGNVVLLISEGRDISELKNAREALLIAQKRLEHLLSSSPSIIYSCQPTAPYGATFVSENITVLFGYEPQEFLEDAEFWVSHIHPDDQTCIFAEKPKLFEQGHHAYEYRFLHKDGTYHWILDTLKLVRDEEGNPIECIGSMSDITQRKQIEAELAESQRWLWAITEANPNILYVHDLIEQRNVYSNREIYTILGYTSKEVQDMGMAVLPTLIHPADFVRALEHFKRFETAKEGEILEFEYRMKHKNGEMRWLFSRETVLARNTDGTPKQILGTATDISDKKQVEEALRQSEERFQLAVEGSGLGLWDWTINTKEIYLSPQWKTMLGYEVEEIENSFPSMTRLIHPQDLPKVLEAINDHLEGRSLIYEIEFRMLSKQGEWKWILSHGKLMELDESGKPLRITGMHKDISDRKAIEIALQQSEARLQKLADNVPGMLYELLLQPDGSYCFTYVSSGCREINEVEPEQLLENPAIGIESAHPDDRQRLYESINISAQTLEPWVWEGRIITPSGTLKWVRGGARPERYANGEILWHGLVVDVSDRHRAELELKTAKIALERQIQRVLLQERITQEIRSSLKSEQIFQTAANQIGQTFGINRCVIHTYLTQPFPIIPILAEYLAPVAEYLAPGYSSMMDLEIPVIDNPHAQLLLSQDKAVKSDDVYNDPLLAGIHDILRYLGLKSLLVVRTSYQGKPNGVIGLLQCDHFRHWTEEEIDLLEAVAVQMGIALAQANLLEQEKQQRRELAQQNHALEKAKLEAEAANRAKSQFLSKMSHELRTPLNAILGFTQVMAHDESLTREHKEYLGIINRSGEHLLDLINDILSMSKIESGQVSLKTNRFDLYRLLQSLEEMLQLKATSIGLELIFERASDVPQYIETDESKLRQVLINLLGNAIKFTQTGRVTLRVRREIENEKNRSNSQFLMSNSSLLFEIEDTGLGIAPAEIGTLFDPFVQTETGRQSMEGTGLGLPISQQFVRLMGGEITVSSTLGQGSIFTFDIQAGWANSADEKPIFGKQWVIGLQPNQPQYRILIVEDAAVNRKLLVKILEPLGFEVRTANNGQEGVRLWKSWSPHLIWMDVIMPVMDGYEATKQIKQSPKGQNTVIIALTASAFEEQQEAILKAGCDDFLPKPFQREVLLEKMADHLGVRYVYEQQTTPTLPQLSQQVRSLTPNALAVMPAEWVTQLHQAALYADDELMKQLIEQIPEEHNTLRQALRALIDNFLLEQIIQLTESARS